MKTILSLVVLLASAVTTARGAGPIEQPIVLKEHLGHAWDEDLVHQHVELPKNAGLFADRVGLFRIDGNERRRVPVQLSNVVTSPDGSLQSADVWFRTDLPANAT